MKNKRLFHPLLLGAISIALASNNAVAQLDQLPGVPPKPTQIPDAPLVVRPNPPQDNDTPFTPPEDEFAEAEQPIKVNTKFAGWEEASTSNTGRRINDTLRGNWVMVDDNGYFTGMVKPTEGAEIAGMQVMLLNRGQPIKQSNVDEQGRFEFNNVRQGTYALIGWGEGAMFAFGLNVLDYRPEADKTIQRSVTVTAFQNRSTINLDWIRYYAPQVKYRVYGTYPTDEGPDDPASLYGVAGLVSNQPKSIPATSISSHQVLRTLDGRIVGRVHQFNSAEELAGRPVDVRSTKVLLLEGDAVVAATTTDNYGTFEFFQVPNGTYGLVAAGVDGLGITGITVGPGTKAQPAQVFDFNMVSAETIGWLNHQAVEVAYRRILLRQRPPEIEPQFPPYNPDANPINPICFSRNLSYQEWCYYCKGHPEAEATFGSGRFIRDITGGVRRGVDRVDTLFENAFQR